MSLSVGKLLSGIFVPGVYDSMVRHLALAVLITALSGCSGPEEEQGSFRGPDDVLRSFVANMRQVHGEGQAGEAVFELLWKPARDNLIERARRASALSGRQLSPGELIVPSWFALHLALETTEVRIDGDWAEITVSDPSRGSVQVRCKLEEDGWKVALELPPLAAIRQRDVEVIE
jgi:hypothetical protein